MREVPRLHQTDWPKITPPPRPARPTLPPPPEVRHPEASKLDNLHLPGGGRPSPPEGIDPEKVADILRQVRGMESDDLPDDPGEFEPDDLPDDLGEFEPDEQELPSNFSDGVLATDAWSPDPELLPTDISDDLADLSPAADLRGVETPEAGIDRPLPTFEELRWVAEATFTPDAWTAQLDHHREVATLMARVDKLIERLAELPLVADREALVRRLQGLSRSDTGECLRLIGRALEELAPARARVVLPAGPEDRVDLLERSIEELAEREAPSIVVLPAPDSRLPGRVPGRAVSDVEIRNSRAVMFGSDATLTVVHHCEVARPVIEIAALTDHPDAGPSWGWWSVTPSLGPMRAGADDGVRTRIVSCSGVSIGDNNVQETVIEHRMTSCPVDMAMLLSDDDIRAALVRCRDDALGPVERIEAREQLRRIVTRVVALTDTSALIPDEAIARQASAANDRPTVRSRGAALTVMHGVGVAVGSRPTVAGHLSTKVGRFHIR